MSSHPSLTNLKSTFTNREKRLTNPVTLMTSIIFDLSFVIFKTSDGILHHRAWPIAVGIYYLMLFIMRMILLAGLHKRAKISDEQKTARRIGISLLILNLILVGMMVEMLTTNAVTKYGLIVAVVDALYLIYRIIVTTKNAVHYKKSESPFMTTITYVSFVASMVAILMTQTSLLEAFGETDLTLMRILNATTSVFVATTILGLSIGLLKRSKGFKYDDKGNPSLSVPPDKPAPSQ